MPRVQEGLVFVSMSPDDLISGTEAYQIEYSSRTPALSPTPSAPDDQLLSLREAVEDPQIWEQSRQGMEEQIERLRLRSRRMQMETSIRAERDHQREEQGGAEDEDDVFAEYCPYHVDEPDATAPGVSAPTPPPYTVTTESGGEQSDENEELPNVAAMAARWRRQSRWRPETEDDGNDLLSRLPSLRRAPPLHFIEDYSDRPWMVGRYLDAGRPRRLHAPSRIEPKESDGSSEDLLEPHARFFIARHKNKITIKFHPAV